MAVEVQLPAGWCLDWVFWRFKPDVSCIPAALETPLNIEQQQFFLWGSKVNFRLPADVYAFLLHGHVYTNDFVWPRKWKFCSELDAYGLYLALDGLALATGKHLYPLLKKQILYSVITRQATDGGWHQGEWTDLMESHYRLHNSAMLMLEAGLEETGDVTIRNALERAAAFIAQCTDSTEIGAWFLHDSLEQSADAMEEMRRQTNTPWIPSRTLGKSPTNKLILNTHLDAIVALDRYREVTGDGQYAELLASARKAARSLLALRPAEPLYRLVYWAIHLTLLPKAEAMRLSWPLRALKRLTWMYVTPQLHRVKRAFPRLVMPGGLIERHVAPLHHDVNYHPVNVMDLIRYRRRFPEEPFAEIIVQAIQAVASCHLLQYWSEMQQRQFALAVWVDAMFQLCSIDPDERYRRYLAEAMLIAEDVGLGLPPSLLGCDPEVVGADARTPCPSPTDPRLRLANLSRDRCPEILVVNPTPETISVDWERSELDPLSWIRSDGQPISSNPPLTLLGRGWLIGRKAI
jgi:hypothetical protein